LHRYYLNGNSAYRLVLHLKGVGEMEEDLKGEKVYDMEN